MVPSWLVQVYLSGQEVPSLYITYYKHSGPHAEQHVSVPAMPLETALQETLFHPAIAVPKVEGVGGGLGSHASQMAPPMGLVRFVEEEVEQWMEAGGLQRLHAASHKVLPMLHSLRTHKCHCSDTCSSFQMFSPRQHTVSTLHWPQQRTSFVNHLVMIGVCLKTQHGHLLLVYHLVVSCHVPTTGVLLKQVAASGSADMPACTI